MRDFPSHIFSGENFAIIGLGKHGLAAARRILSCGGHVHIYDDKKATREHALQFLEPFSPSPKHLIVAPFDKEQLKRFTALIPSPGIALTHPFIRPFIDAGIPLYCDTEILQLAVRRAGSKARFVGITGTNGKSTTTVLTHHLLQKGSYEVVCGGNLGPSSLSLPLLGDNGIYAIEMSSYMLEIMGKLHFDVACLLNITPDHLQRHKTMENYGTAKAHIFQNQSTGDLRIIGIDDTYCLDILKRLEPHQSIIETISRDNPKADYYGKKSPRPAVIHGDEEFLIENPSLHGAFNRQNCAAALAIAQYFGLKEAILIEQINNFKGLPHRQEAFLTSEGVTFIDDSKATNGDSTIQALREFDDVIWIGGGEAKSDGIEKLIPYFSHIKKAYLFGQDRQKLAQTLKDYDVPFEVYVTLDEILPHAYRFAKARLVPVILFSPACASFDQYDNFEKRGQHFKELARTCSSQGTKNE